MKLPLEGHFRVLIENAEEQREEWLKEREKGIGASESPAILGVSPWSSPVEVWGRKIGTIPPVEETGAMRWGRKLQTHVGEEVGAELGGPWVEDERLLQSVEHPFLLATPDGWFNLADHPELGEIKTTGYGDDWSEGVPLHVWTQVQHQMAVTGEDHATVGVLFLMDRQHYHAPVERDDRFINDVLLPEVEKFWAKVQSREVPDPDASDSCTAALKILFAESTKGKSIELEPSFLEIHRELVEVKAQLRELDKQKKGLENQIKTAMGDAEAARITGTNVHFSFKTQYVAEKMRAAHTRRPLTAREKKS